MCKALNYAVTIRQTLNTVCAQYEAYPGMLSKVDKEISEIYHQIEVTKMNASTGYKMAKLLQTKLRERREIKHERETLQRMLDVLDRHKLRQRLRDIERDIVKRDESFATYSLGWNV